MSTPSSDEPIDLVPIQQELRQAARLLMDRGLYFAAQWTAELVTQIRPPTPSPHPVTVTSSPAVKAKRLLFSPPTSLSTSSLPPSSPPSPPPSPPPSYPLPPPLDDHLLLAKCHFDLREYRRCAHLLESLHSPTPHHLFLRFYALYLAGEARRDEEVQAQASSASAAPAPHNQELAVIVQQLQGTTDPFCQYLLALVYKQSGQPGLALTALLSSLHGFPCNWSAWLLLTGLVADHHSLASLQLPPHFLRSFFFVHFFLDVHSEQSDVDSLHSLIGHLQSFFPASTHLLTAEALSHYLHQHYDEAEAILAHLHSTHPYRLTCMDTYSNILYVKEDRATLSFLAHHLHSHCRYHELTQTVTGNYYALKQQHERAILHFRRALTLNPAYLSAYTLMGHEYIELHNEAAAITAYRRAIDINPRDFRAWYGLGQAYELLGMNGSSVYYYRQACVLRPFDARMWCAQGNGYEKMGKEEEAVRCYEKAMGEEDREGVAVFRLARLWGRRGEGAKAAKYWRLVLHKQDQMERGDEAGEGVGEEEEEAGAKVGGVEGVRGKVSHSVEAMEAVVFLAEWSKQQGRWKEAEAFAQRMMFAGGSLKDQGKSLIIDIRASQAQ